MKVSVVTPNYNGKKFLKSYFNSLNEDTANIGEVIIVDNGSDDGSLDYIKSLDVDYPIIIIENSENLGFAKAVNQGILKAKYDYIFSLNNDTKVKPDAIRHLLNSFESNVFSTQALMIKCDGVVDDAGDEYNLAGWTKKTGEGKDKSIYNEICEIFSSCAGAALYDKSKLIELGLFDDNYFAYMEDVDLAIRANINGYKNLMCPKAVVYHVGSGTSGSRHNDFKVKLAARNNIWTVYKNLPLPLKILNFIFLFLGFLIKYIFFSKKGFGNSYKQGLKEGLASRHKLEKVKFEKENTFNYFKMEWKLIINTLKFLERK